MSTSIPLCSSISAKTKLQLSSELETRKYLLTLQVTERRRFKKFYLSVAAMLAYRKYRG